ncbi:MAG: nicotinamide riboside transporter PnuC [Gammaproteobacteria bacterium]|nr:nicotinamide riboside transporter PnuC [Gammaproteobacteria bacterium]
MTDFFGQLLAQAQAFSQLEIVAVLLAIAYLLLAIRQSIWCWYCAGVSTAIYVWLFIDAKLYMESVLNGFYFAMAIYGWFVWRAGRTEDHERPVVVWPRRTHAIAIAVIVILSALNGYLLLRYTDAAFPFIDSLTTWSAIWATFLVARKVLENWWYWLVIDVASVFIYMARDLQLTSLLFVIYVIMIPFGLISWSRSMREQTG